MIRPDGHCCVLLLRKYTLSDRCSLAWTRRSLRQPQAGLQGLVEVFASFTQACRDSSKSLPAPRRLAGPRRSLRQLQAGLQGLVEVFASFKQACMDSIYRKSASSRLAWPRFTVNQRQARLHGFDIQYISLKQACRARYTVFQLSKNKQRYHTNKHK